MKKKEAMEEAIRMMKAVGIANPEVRPMSIPIRCRGGMRRVMIAMALACQPQRYWDCMKAHCNGSDVTIQAQILDLIAR